MRFSSIFKNKRRKILFTTPSHDGKICIMHKFYNWYKNDISEVESINPEESLIKAQEDAALIYKTKSTHFLTNGSTSGIIAAVLAVCKNSDKLLIWENAHPCHKNAGILAGANIITYKLPYNNLWGIYEPLSLPEIEKLLMKHHPKAIIITSPTYEGMVSDIKSIKQICNKFNTFLIVDQAHGALYNFSDYLPQSAVPFADFTIESLHKTAGGINPTALLHCNSSLSPQFALNLINTTSPSYPMLATIEANIKYLNSQKGRLQIENLIFNIKRIKEQLSNINFYGDDITKILMHKEGLSGWELSELLYNKYNIEDERTNPISTLLLTGIGTTSSKLNKLLSLKNI